MIADAGDPGTEEVGRSSIAKVRGQCSLVYKWRLDRKILYSFRVPNLHNDSKDQLLAKIVYVWFTGDGGQGKEWEQREIREK